MEETIVRDSWLVPTLKSHIPPLPPTLVEGIANIRETLKNFNSASLKPRLPPSSF